MLAFAQGTMASSSAPESGIASLSIADDPHTDAVSQITHMLGSVWQVRIRDDARTFTGNFMAVDRQVRAKQLVFAPKLADGSLRRKTSYSMELQRKRQAERRARLV